MRGVLVDADGAQWWTTQFACAQLDVTPARLRDWVRRSKRDPRFPQVDPPMRHGNVAAYRAQQLLEAELVTAESTRGRRRAA